MRPSIALLAALIAFALPHPAEAITVISATAITANTVWGPTGSPADSSYLVSPSTGNVLAIQAGATLTIQPGTTVYFAASKVLQVGGATAGSLSAVGTVGQPIVFSSSSGLRGGWAGIDFTNNSDLGGASSSLSYCTIKGGGSAGYQVRVTDSNGVTIFNSGIAEHTNVGLVLDNANPSVTLTVFRDREAGTFACSGSIPNVAGLFAANTFFPRADGKYEAIELIGGTVGSSITLSKPPAGFSYITDGNDFAVSGSGTVLTVADGSVVKFLATSYLETRTGAALRAKRVVFTSSRDDTLGDTNGDGATAPLPGQWEALSFTGVLSAQTVLDSCVIRYGGTNFGAGIRTANGADPTVRWCVISQNSPAGLSMQGVETGSNVLGNVFWGSTQYEISAEPWAMANLLPNNLVAPSVDGKYNGYELIGGNVGSSITLSKPPAGFSYITDGNDFAVSGSGTVLTVADGSVVKFLATSYLETRTGAALRAKRVVFTSSRDDTLGDTNGDGATVPLPGQWEALSFTGVLSAQTVVDSCVIRYGGTNYGAGIRTANGAEPTISNSVISRSSGSGILVTGTGEPTIQSCSVHDNTTLGLEITTSTLLAQSISGNVFAFNGTYEASAYPLALPSLVSNNTFVPAPDHRFDAIFVQGATLTSNLTVPVSPAGLSYLIAPNQKITVKGASNPTLTLLRGTVLKFQGTGGIDIGGASSAEKGKMVAHGVLFTSSFHDTIGDATGDGAGVTPGVWLDPGGTPPSAGDWVGLTFSGFADSTSSVDSSAVEYAATGLDLTGHVAQVNRVLLMHNIVGAQFSGSVVRTLMAQCDIVANDSTGIRATANAQPSVNQSNIAENGRLGVSNTSAGVTLDATNNWWGSVTGPNPPGSGDRIEGSMNTSPFLTAPRTPLPGNNRDMVTLTIAWNASPVVTTCDLTDALARHWYSIDFSEDAWTAVVLPNAWSGSNNDRYFRGRFSWSGKQMRLAYQANDGLELYCNGVLLARAGYTCHGTRCVNGPPGCVSDTTAPSLFLTPFLVPGENVIAVHVTNGSAGGSFGAFGDLQLPTLVEETSAPGTNWLGWNAPNPFNPVTEIQYRVAAFGRVQARVFAIDGRLVRTLRDSWMPAGVHRIQWDGTGASGESLASGVYLFKLTYPDGRGDVRKMSLVR